MKTLKELRMGSSMTQEELANLFEVSPRTIQNMERDSTNIKDSLLSKYIKAFGVSYDEIFSGNEYENFVLSKDKKKSFVVSFARKEEGVG